MKDGILDLKPKETYDDIHVAPQVLEEMRRIGLTVEDLEGVRYTFEELRDICREREVPENLQKKITNLWRLVQMTREQRLMERLQRSIRRRQQLEQGIQQNQEAIEANQELLESDSDSDSGSSVTDSDSN